MNQTIPSENVKLKRAYEEPSSDDGVRILIDRLWPRGISKKGAALDLWMKEIAPSDELRKWFHHEPDRWSEFQQRYRSEVDANQPLLDQLRSMARKGPITLVYSARNEEQNNATALKDFILER